MVLLASGAGLSLSWPRMKLGQENPFQNAPGPFIYALPNLAGTCPFSFSFSDTGLFGGSFSGDSIDASSSSSSSSSPDPLHQRHHHYHRCQHDPPSECAEPQATATSSTTSTRKEDAPDGLSTESSSSLSPTDESHFGLDEDITISLPPLTPAAAEGGIEQAEAEAEAEQQQQQQESEASEPFTVSPTPTDSNSITRTDSDSPDVSGSKEEEGGEEKRKKKKGVRRRRKRNGRSRSERGVGPIPPRFMGLSGIHYYGLWTQYGLCPPQAPPLAMNHHVWPFAAYRHHDHSTGGFVVPSNSPAPQLWNPMVPASSFVVGVPVASC